MENNEIPYFEDEANKPLEGLEIVERDNVEVFLYDPVTKKILCLDWKDFGWKTVVIGGLDGDSPIDAAKKEVLEETGYKNISFIKEIGKTRSGYYAAHKKENRIANTIGLLFQLVDYEQVEVNPEELEKHIPVWIPIDEVSSYLTISAQQYFWDIVFRLLKEASQ